MLVVGKGEILANILNTMISIQSTTDTINLMLRGKKYTKKLRKKLVFVKINV